MTWRSLGWTVGGSKRQSHGAAGDVARLGLGEVAQVAKNAKGGDDDGLLHGSSKGRG